MSSSRMSQIQRGRVNSPIRLVVYGPNGVGKSSFLADAPGVLFFDLEAGTHALDTDRYKFRDDPDGTTPRTYEEVLSGLEDVIKHPKGVSILAIDTLDRLEELIRAHVCKSKSKQSIEDFGFGNGYKFASDLYRTFLARLDDLRAVGVSVALIAHSKVVKFYNPEGEDYDRYQIAAHDLIATQTKNWADVVGFLRMETFVKDGKSYTAGRRVLHLQRSAAFDAKSRTGASEIDISNAHPWAEFAASQDAAAQATCDSLVAEIKSELERIGSEFEVAGKKHTAAGILDSIKGAKQDVLTRVVNGLKGIKEKQS